MPGTLSKEQEDVDPTYQMYQGTIVKHILKKRSFDGPLMDPKRPETIYEVDERMANIMIPRTSGVPFLSNHDESKVIGKVFASFRCPKRGTWDIKYGVRTDTALGREHIALIDSGAWMGLSLGHEAGTLIPKEVSACVRGARPATWTHKKFVGATAKSKVQASMKEGEGEEGSHTSNNEEDRDPFVDEPNNCLILDVKNHKLGIVRASAMSSELDAVMNEFKAAVGKSTGAGAGAGASSSSSPLAAAAAAAEAARKKQLEDAESGDDHKEGEKEEEEEAKSPSQGSGEKQGEKEENEGEEKEDEEDDGDVNMEAVGKDQYAMSELIDKATLPPESKDVLRDTSSKQTMKLIKVLQTNARISKEAEERRKENERLQALLKEKEDALKNVEAEKEEIKLQTIAKVASGFKILELPGSLEDRKPIEQVAASMNMDQLRLLQLATEKATAAQKPRKLSSTQKVNLELQRYYASKSRSNGTISVKASFPSSTPSPSPSETAAVEASHRQMVLASLDQASRYPSSAESGITRHQLEELLAKGAPIPFHLDPSKLEKAAPKNGPVGGGVVKASFEELLEVIPGITDTVEGELVPGAGSNFNMERIPPQQRMLTVLAFNPGFHTGSQGIKASSSEYYRMENAKDWIEHMLNSNNALERAKIAMAEAMRYEPRPF